jgi:serine protease inhibitor
MTRALSALFAPAAVLVALVGGAVAAAPPTGHGEPEPPEEAALVSANTQFAFALYGELAQRTAPDGNLFFSPYTVSTALGMTWCGARGRTAEQMAVALHLPDDPARLPALFALLDRGLGKAPPAHARLGLTLAAAEGESVRVTAVAPGSSAQRAGLEAGDVILAADGRPVGSAAEFDAALSAAGPRATLAVRRKDAPAAPVVLEEDGAATGAYQLHLASALWGRKGMAFRPEFVRSVGTGFRAEVSEVDFSDPTQAAGRINTWAARQTQNRIREIAGGAVTPATEVVLTSAVYFRAGWACPFPRRATRPAPFWVRPGRQAEAALMARSGRFRTATGPGYRVLELPYAGEALALLVLLPQRDDGLPALEKGLTAAGLAGCLGRLQEEQAEVFLPRFRIASGYDLREPLAALGMGLAFSPDADFSGMAPAPGLRLSAVLHRAQVSVDEEGTEAAAAAEVGVARGRAPVTFRADHPFLVLVRDRNTGTILFLGRVVQPAA